MTIWGIVGFLLLMGAGAYFYYRALGEIRGSYSKKDQVDFSEDELISALQPSVTVAFRRPIMLGAEPEILLNCDKSSVWKLERVGLNFSDSRDLNFADRLYFHQHQIFCLGISAESGQFAQMSDPFPQPFSWMDADTLEQSLLREWPGYHSQLTRVKLHHTAKRPLYPPLTVQILPDALTVQKQSKPTASSKKSAKAKSSSARQQRRKKRTDGDRGLSIERVESAAQSTRSWQDEQRDERSGEADESPQVPIDLVQSDTPVHSAIRMDSRPENQDEVTRKTDEHWFDEWDCTRGLYRRRYCRIQVTPSFDGNGTGSSWLQETLAQKRQIVREVTQLFLSLKPIPQKLRRQLDGDSLDLDAVVEERIQRKKGGRLNEALYERTERMQRSVAVTLLIDLSASTERWTGKRRAFEIGIETAALFSLGQKILGDDTEILGFSGSGPADVWITQFKSFSEPWSEVILQRLSQARPQAFTRLGAAIRYATESLVERPQRQRLLLLLSDAKPQDEDGYEGHYAWSDTRKALDQARRRGVLPYCLTLDPEMIPLLQLFFRNHWALHRDPESFPLRLPRVFARLTQIQ